MAPADFLGVGLAFPPTAAPDGELELTVAEEDIGQALKVILETDPESA